MIKVLKLHEDAQLPKASHPGSCLAWDIYAIEDAEVKFGMVTKIKTGIAVQVEGGINAGFLLRERSGHATQGLKLLGGVIDPDYQGEWVVMLTSLNEFHTPSSLICGGTSAFNIKKGDRIAQAIMLPTLTALPIDWTEAFKTETERGSAGFGSTGTR